MTDGSNEELSGRWSEGSTREAGEQPGAQPGRGAELLLDAAATTAASLELNGVPCVRSVIVRAAERLHGCILRITIDGVAAQPYERGVETVPAGTALAVDVADFTVPLPILRQSTEREQIDLVASLDDAAGRVIASARHRLTIVPATHWCGIVNACESLASFVTPNSPAISELLLAASARLGQRTGSGALDGYLSGSPERAQRIAEACFEALAERGVAYVQAMPSFEEQGQKVRTLADTLADRTANCLDLSVALAALLEAAGLAPVIAMGDGHAVVGYATVDEPFADAVHDGSSRLVTRIGLGEFRIIEATGACDARLGYGEALTEGERFLQRASERMRVLDVRAARRAGYHPLPERLAEGGDSDLSTRRKPRPSAWTVVQPAGLPPLPRIKRAPHEQRLEMWKKRLLDLTLRNRLLNDRDKAGIPLLLEGDGVLARLEDVLWNEKSLRLMARGSTRAATEDAANDEIARGWMRSSLEEAELFKRATKAYREARSSLEETGARSLYVAVGFLEYRVETRESSVLAPLLLVPVELVRISRAEGFRVVPVAEDTVPNVALVEYMRNTHGLDIGLAGVIPEDDHGIDVPLMLARVRKAIADVAGARVVPTAKLGNYSFKKLPLFEEMRSRGKELAAHPVVRTLLDGAASESIRRARLVSPDEVDAAAPFTYVRLPLAADSSQIAAVCSATAGTSFVLQGPPGTGKSQTITNLLAECLSRGKRVLFIAEKSAALEVVYDRLRKTGLGAFALDLHADHASKPSFVAQIKRALDEIELRAAPGSRQFPVLAANADRVRARLAAACNALHGERGEGMTAHAAIERSVGSAAHRSADPAIAAQLASSLEGVLPPRVSATDLTTRLDAVNALAAALDELPRGIGAELADLAPTALLSAEQASTCGRTAQDAADLVSAAELAATELAKSLGVTPPRTLAAMLELLAAAKALAIASPAAAFAVESALAPDHTQRLASIRRSLELAAAASKAESALAQGYDRAVLSAPLAQFVGDLRASREKFIVMRWLAARKVRGELVRLAKTPPPGDHELLLKEAERVLAISESIKAAEPHREIAGRFARADGSIDLDDALPVLDAAQAAATAIRTAFARDVPIAAAHAPRAAGQPALAEAAAALGRPLEALRAALAQLDRSLGAAPPLAANAAETAALASRLTRIARHAAELPAWSACTIARAAANRLGLAPASDAMVAGTLPGASAEHTVEAALLAAWTRARLREEPALSDCATDRLDEIRRNFATAMAEYRKGAAEAVATLVRDRTNAALDSADHDEAMRRAMKTVLELRALTTIRRPIRRVMLDGAAAIAALKPIVLASPLSAATLLPPEFPPFDLVVFDEASQVPVWDAACAISRGAASVIVGDSKQLPPTNFFDRKDAGADERSSAGADADLADALEPLESVLEASIAAGIPERSLLWHYRSRDERLIEFSNRRSYGSRLQTFPAPHRAHPNLGVEFRFVGGTYDRAGTSTNRAEAEAVVAELSRRLLDHDACSANRSLGVVTFSEAQQTLVQDLLDEAVDRNATLRERLAEAEKAGEPVFVKNLENVQGDERATMLFSICYGRDASGAMYHNFGPLNLSGGERRLNVAVTRAREKIVLLTSIRAGDLDPAKCNSKGAQDLRDYLAFAEHGTVPASRDEGRATREIDVSAIERAIATALEQRGWRVDLHVGRSRDYRVSIALADKSSPDRWTLGVELDGAFYGAAPTVVDREVVRDGVLGALGWRTIKVSCIDWLRDPRKVLDRIEQATAVR